MQDSHASVLSSAKRFFSGALLSRIMGMVRDLTMAFCFGSAPQVAAFMVAYRLAHLLRRLFGEGVLQGGFIPHFEFLKSKGEEEAIHFYRELKNSLMVFLGVVIVLGSVLFLVWANQILLMMTLMFPGVLFLSLYALDCAVLQSKKSFFRPSVAPVFFNLVWIVSAFSFRQWPIDCAMFALSGSVLLAFVAQWWVTARPVVRWSRSVKKTKTFLFSSAVRKMFKPLACGMVGVGAAQINSALDALFAAYSHPSGPAYLWYAIRIQQAPLALLGIALANALLPPLSRAAQGGAWDRYHALLKGALLKSTALLLPCVMGLLFFAELGVGILYGHGAFLKGDVFATARCLQAYALGIIPTAYVLLLANGFYSRKEYRRPMQASLVSVITNLFLNSLFVFCFHWGPSSIALATSLSAAINCLLLFRNGFRSCSSSPYDPEALQDVREE